MNIMEINRNKQFVFRLVLECLAVVLCCTAAQAQKQADVRDYVDFDLEIANNHLWRGIEVSDGLVARLKAAGYRVILATNPIFPAVATESRIR